MHVKALIKVRCNKEIIRRHLESLSKESFQTDQRSWIQILLYPLVCPEPHEGDGRMSVEGNCLQLPRLCMQITCFSPPPPCTHLILENTITRHVMPSCDAPTFLSSSMHALPLHAHKPLQGQLFWGWLIIVKPQIQLHTGGWLAEHVQKELTFSHM